MRLIVASAMTLLFTSCFGAFSPTADGECAASAQAIPLCTILADSAKYDGREVTVRGLHRLIIHGTILWGEACPKMTVNMRSTANRKADKHAVATIRSITKKDPYASVEEVLRGTFRVAQQGQCFGQVCAIYEIEETELLCAAPTKLMASGAADPKVSTSPTTH